MTRNRLRLALIALGCLVSAGALGAVLWDASRLPDGPVEVAWDLAPCAHCHMHVGTPGFAAQVQTLDHEVLDFDDPGCLFHYLHARRPAVHAVWFHHGQQDRWLRLEAVAFVEVPAAQSPMGYGLAAVDRGTPASLTPDQAAARVLAAQEAP